MIEKDVNMTGYRSWYHNCNDTFSNISMELWVTNNTTRRALHVGNRTFSWAGDEQQVRMLGTFLRTILPQLDTLLKEGYHYLVAPGNMDTISGHLGVRQLSWDAAQGWLNNTRFIWKVEERIAGYITQTSGGGQATYALVRNAGHGTFFDNREWLRNLAEWFFNDLDEF